MRPSTTLLLMLVILVRAAIADIPASARDPSGHPVSINAAKPVSVESESLKTVASWLSAEFGLTVAELPHIEFVARERMIALRHRGLPSDHMSEGRDILAVYDDDARTIYLPQGWTGQTVAEASILVHEMVHHAQNLGGMKAECPQAREKLAYEAQQRLLRRFGTGLEEEFSIDGFTLLVLTNCGF
ncbi:DUF6647 family protein [Taklimakanibacter deserti]|uniref:DUF6647 family protein n=1 Tax=Taklimakanibacter deserti TaxID=2267839 RepID=UPI0034D670B9